MTKNNGKLIPPAKPHGRRYPWAEWFAQGTVALIRGVDFDCLPHGMAQAARNAASRMGYSVRIEIGEDAIVVTAVLKRDRGRARTYTRGQAAD